MVTAPPAVWENYVQVCLCCSEKDILTVCFTQSHEKAKKFMTRPFLLYDDIAELCDDAIATGAGAFRPGYAPPASPDWDTDISGPSFRPTHVSSPVLTPNTWTSGVLPSPPRYAGPPDPEADTSGARVSCSVTVACIPDLTWSKQVRILSPQPTSHPGTAMPTHRGRMSRQKRRRPVDMQRNTRCTSAFLVDKPGLIISSPRLPQ